MRSRSGSLLSKGSKESALASARTPAGGKSTLFEPFLFFSLPSNPASLLSFRRPPSLDLLRSLLAAVHDVDRTFLGERQYDAWPRGPPEMDSSFPKKRKKSYNTQYVWTEISRYRFWRPYRLWNMPQISARALNLPPFARLFSPQARALMLLGIQIAL